MKISKIRLLIAEDHTIVRQGLIDILSRYDDICIVGEAENGNMLIKKYDTFKPDVVLTDIEMPKMKGTEATKEILLKYPEAKIVFLTMYNSDEYIYKTYKLGAWGLIPKEVIKSELVDAIRTVHEGYKYFMGKSNDDIKEIINKIERYKNITESRSLQLTQREKEVLMILAQGKTSEQIAGILGNVTKRSVESHRSSMMKKLNFTKAVELIRFAVQFSNNIGENIKP
jgi:DNA-binding NarL/FixJ family response regulator